MRFYTPYTPIENDDGDYEYYARCLDCGEAEGVDANKDGEVHGEMYSFENIGEYKEKCVSCESTNVEVILYDRNEEDDEKASICKTCGSETIWGGDHTLEDYGKEGEGIVSNYSCSNLECETTLLVEWIYGYEGDEIILHWFEKEDDE